MNTDAEINKHFPLNEYFITNPNHLDSLVLKNRNGLIYEDKCKVIIDCLSERRIRQLSSFLRKLPNWHTLTDEKAKSQCKKWVAEASRLGATDAEVAYAFDELNCYKAIENETKGHAILSAVERVWLSHPSAESNEQREQMIVYAKILENAVRIQNSRRESLREYDNTLQMLVDPSLYVLDYKATSVLSEPIKSPQAALKTQTLGKFPGTLRAWKNELMAAGYTVPTHKTWSGSRSYSWIPAEFHIAEDCKTTIHSYINNLHPCRHVKLYDSISEVFAKFVPLFEQVITDAVYPTVRRVYDHCTIWFQPTGPVPENYAIPGYEERFKQWKNEFIFVEPQPELPATLDRPIKPYSLRNRNVQVCVEMHNISLTPEYPEYRSSDWYMESTSNEHIVAVGIYYYDIENVTESRIEFREAVKNKMDCLKEYATTFHKIYGIFKDPNTKSEVLEQKTGHVDIKPGQYIAYPNTYQQRVSNFMLKDMHRSGHCKALVFYLVNPSLRIPSSEIIPPQQQQWWAEELAQVNIFADLPLVVKDLVLGKVEYPIPLEKAKKTRELVVQERQERNERLNTTHFTPKITFESIVTSGQTIYTFK